MKKIIQFILLFSLGYFGIDWISEFRKDNQKENYKKIQNFCIACNEERAKELNNKIFDSYTDFFPDTLSRDEYYKLRSQCLECKNNVEISVWGVSDTAWWNGKPLFEMFGPFKKE